MGTVLHLDSVTYSVRYRRIIGPLSWSLNRGVVHTLVGGNGSGKTTLARLIDGSLRPETGGIRFGPSVESFEDIAYLSFEKIESTLARERKLDETWFGDGSIDYGTTGAELLGLSRDEVFGEHSEARELVRLLRLTHLLDRGCRQYSTGEFRKILLCREILGDPKIIILEEPFDGLDADARGHINETVTELAGRGLCVVLFLNRRSEVPDNSDEIVYLSGGRLTADPPRDAVHHNLPLEAPGIPAGEANRTSGDSGAGERDLIVMDGVEVFYSGLPILRNITWRAAARETWMISGPNGSGKSTLLSLISGDNPKAYGQGIELFGRPKGSGESIWELKKRIGFVSGDFQMKYFIRTGVLETVLSGFYDSVGLYDSPGRMQIESALHWLRQIGLEDKKNEILQRLSFGEQRMVLLARAMIKNPEILIADEPCQGLDDANRADVLGAFETIGRSRSTLLLYVTHDPKEFLSCPHHSLELVPAEGGGYTAAVSFG